MLYVGAAHSPVNCSYGHGASVFEVIDSVMRVSGRDFPVEICGRRAGDPAALVSDVARIRSILDWRPQFVDLDTIVSHALAWEQLLGERKSGADCLHGGDDGFERVAIILNGATAEPFVSNTRPPNINICASAAIGGQFN
jgi:hypothetical protein